ncbi:hypothetical protein GQ457_14G013570 [Hibiscus cannabinus]
MWTKQEEVALIECLHNLALDPHWKCDNGTFRSGYLSYLEKIVKMLKRQYNALSRILNIASGIGWNKEEKCLTAQKDVFDYWVRSHQTVVGLRNNSFPFFDGLVQIFGKQRAIGAAVETVADAMENLAAEDNAFLNVLDAEDKIIKDSDSMEEIGALNNQTSIVFVTTMKRDVYSKKRPQSDDGLLDLVEEMIKVGVAYQKTAQVITVFFQNRHKK